MPGSDRYMGRHSRTRSRSPDGRRKRQYASRSRSRSPQRSRDRRHRRHGSSTPHGGGTTPASLPFDARTLTKSDFGAFRALFAYYLDLQKGKSLARMDEREARGRWKSFVGKWNRGELREGWYDPDMFATAEERAAELLSPDTASRDDTVARQPSGPADRRGGDRDRRRGDESWEREGSRGDCRTKDDKGYGRVSGDEDDDEDEDDDDMVPPLPPTIRSGSGRPGPKIPTLDDLAAQRDERVSEAQAGREKGIEDIRAARARDRKEQKERLEELVPRADPGTRERRLEKRAAVNEKMRGFREGSPGGDAAVGDGELMGEGGGLDELRREKAREERRKTERELRREEIARAKEAEREERVRLWREREEGTMKGLKELARQRFG
ncbi:hypothetical protein SODALDRAFT_335752 [Sodiomyces alkalinus F11]|uniref:Uncharacterized protein n=1 Tax=Sodiomyces alkalinus (strain CBS 110278 / VKM F-3762 / F11) TaxID=1314773 RepID=A0A3N2PQ96_SODAK|nr:hypothetical protein SODALDRAFT_335752 [Sodiomyces alkalinus F11]ROT36648.1 hypothetical protein SODALDRAFT_335752 [Sodiomyces alkalinus F11]